ncbi:MAG: serine--tRNA ligase [Pontiellaceae bacterium]
MLDIRFIRENQAAVEDALGHRNADNNLTHLIDLDDKRRNIIIQSDALKAERNAFSKKIGELIKQGSSADEAKANVREMGDQISTFDDDLREIERDIRDQILYIPNIPAKDVPIGKNEEDNPVIRSWGDPKSFDFEPVAHWDIGESLGLFDFNRGAKIAGSGFPLFTGNGAKLERALIQFMLDLHTQEHGYKEVSPPFFCNKYAMTGTGQLPKFEEDMYAIPQDGLYAIPTAEVPVTNLYADEILEMDLPLSHTAYTPCFRREAGAAGKDTRGLQRLHQFDKVELVKFTKPDQSEQEHERLTAHAEEVLKRLELPYRVIELCTGDLGFSAAKCYDIELWAPAQEKWIEVSSCSNFKDYQARRANIRYRDESGKTKFVHTLNGSGVALPRLVIALLENNQTVSGKITLPKALHSYMNGMKFLS